MAETALTNTRGGQFICNHLALSTWKAITYFVAWLLRPNIYILSKVFFFIDDDDDDEAEEEWGKLGNKACEVESLLSIGQGMG